MPKLFIRLLSPAVATEEGHDIASAWMIQEDNGSIRASGETDFRGLSDLIDPGTDWVQTPGNIIVTVPAEQVLSLCCEVPGRNIGQMRRALPFLVEEFVTTDIESMHLATGELKRGAPTRVNLIDRTLLHDWLACLADLEIRPGYLFSEAELLPAEPGQASLLLDGDRVLVRTPEQAAAVDRENLALAVGALAVDRVVVVHGSLSEIEVGQIAHDLEVDTAQAADTRTVLDYVAAHWRTADAVNLLQGEYRARQPTNPMWQRWRPVAALAALWVGLALLVMVSEALYAGYRADALEARSVEIYRDLFPREQRVINPRRQLQSKLGERPDGPGAGLLDYLAPLAASMASGTRIGSLSYDQARGELAVDLFTDGFDALDKLKQGLGAAGVNVEITSAEQLENGVRARLRLQGLGARA